MAKKKTPLRESLTNLRIADLLSHTSGLPDWLCLWVNCPNTEFESLSNRDKLIYRLNQIKPQELKRSHKYCYSDLGFILLGLCLEFQNETTIDHIFTNHLKSLGLKNNGLSYNQTDREKSHSIPTGYCKIRQQHLNGFVHDENSSILNGLTGHAGIFGTAEDVISYLKCVLKTEWGMWMFQEMTKRRSATAKQMIGLCGWHQGSGESSSPFGMGQAIGHLGFTGTSFWVEPNTLNYSIILTNRVISGRFCNWMTDFRKRINDLLYTGLTSEQ